MIGSKVARVRILCLAWAPFGHRMDELGEIVGGTRLNLTVLYGPRYLAPIRYIALLLRTLLVLFVKGPDIVYAQNPPVFCPLVCLLYTRATRRKLLVDHHSIWSVKTIGRGPVSSVIGWLEGFVARSANANTAPHSRWGRKLTEMRGRGVVVIGDFVNRNPFTRDERLRKKYADTNVIAVASHGGHPLERIEVESGAVGSNPSVTLLICGPEEKLRARLSKGLPENARYLGFLPMEEYLRLKASADFALNITDEPYTLSHVLFEYAASSLPMVSSKQPVVEEVFGESIIYADSSNVREVSEKVKQFADDPGTMTEYKRRIMTKYEELERRRNDELGRLRRIVYDPTH